MKNKVFILILMICSLISSCSREQIPKTDELIKKHIQARGGYEKLKTVKTLILTGKHVQQGSETPVIIKLKRPDLFGIEIRFPGRLTWGAYDGKKTWWLNKSSPTAKPQILPEDQAVMFTRYVDFGDLFVDYKKKGQKIETIDIEKIAESKAYKLKTNFTNDIFRLVWLDSNNFQIVKEAFKSRSQPEAELAVYYRDYREINGIMFPFFHEIKMENRPAEQTIIEKIEMNVDLDDSIFKMPKVGKEKLSETEFEKELDDYLKLSVDRDMFSGVVLVSKNGKPFFKKAYGMADKERNIPNRINTRFCIGSMNKMFTATAVAQLVVQGKLSYDDSAGKYLENDWLLPEVGKKVKISHLLTHTSGIAEYLTDELWNDPGDIYRTLDEHKPLVSGKSLIFKPGTQWRYCNTGFIILGAIIEKLSGEKYQDYINTHIYEPAGMSDTLYFSTDRTIPNVAMGYEKVDEAGKPYWRKTVHAGKIAGSPSGGGYSTVDDLHKFAVALMGDKLMSKKSRELHMSPKPKLKSMDYGYGFFFSKSYHGRIVGHGGSAPGVSGNFRMFLDRGYIVIILSNYTMASLDILTKIKDLLPSEKTF
jgi:CubicO group peptidase (beta-lactamase class C family)/outer membrane lipoprotein-sorting protein